MQRSADNIWPFYVIQATKGDPSQYRGRRDDPLLISFRKWSVRVRRHYLVPPQIQEHVPMELAVLLKGTLRGLDLETGCEVLAIRQSRPGGEPETYTLLRMLHAPAGWPEGEYVIELEGLRTRALLRNGQWLIDETVTQVRAKKARQGSAA